VNGKVYLIGGVVNPTPSRIAEYDPVADSWRLTNSYKQQFNGKSVVFEDQIYFSGGCYFQAFGFCDDISDSLQIYDPVADVWINRAPMPVGHTGHEMLVHNDRIFVIGGSPRNVGFADRDIDVYDPATDTWRKDPYLPTGLINFGCNSVGGSIFITGPERMMEFFAE